MLQMLNSILTGSNIKDTIIDDQKQTINRLLEEIKQKDKIIKAQHMKLQKDIKIHGKL